MEDSRRDPLHIRLCGYGVYDELDHHELGEFGFRFGSARSLRHQEDVVERKTPIVYKAFESAVFHFVDKRSIVMSSIFL